MSDETRRLLLEAQKADYGLRSTFFYRKLNELGFTAFSMQIEELARVGNAYRWEERTDWGVSESAWEQIQNSSIEPIRVFAHPLICMQNPRLLAYYRSVAAISQKGAKRLALPPIEQFERGFRSALSHDQAVTACRLFNRHISAIIDSTLTFSERDIEALLLASAGAQIDGAWRNAIGEEGEAVVRRLIVSGFLKEGKIATFHKRGGGVVAVSEIDEADMIAHLTEYQGFTLTNGTAIVFSSEPDISLLSTDGKLLAAMEIKAGKDPAGALERLGAAQKSFTHAHKENPAVHTIYVAHP
ncbi:MAG TPA: XcyI family restriction endonuclease [Chthonomonadaceae bacterium]|nr:XcyI family restriction endonuclease [Chthonomonadaceae bacterium]